MEIIRLFDKSENVFTKLKKKSETINNNEMLIGSYFIKKGSLRNQKRYFRLFENFIYYQNVIIINMFTIIKEETDKYPKAFTKIDFNLRFELIRAKVYEEQKDETSLEQIEKITLGRIIGIKFDRGMNTSEIYGTDINII